MTDEQNTESVDATGSSDGSTQTGPVSSTEGEQKTGEPKVDDLKFSKDLEKKLGEQGVELGEYRTFFKNISPLLDKLDGQPDLVQAIIDGKIDEELVKAVAEGKVKLEDAAAITEAHKGVKRELGKEKYDKASSDEVRKLVEEKVSDVRKDMEQKFKNSEELRDFESSVNDFVKNTSDFEEYSEGIAKWFEDHPDQDDISVAYQAVKGTVLTEKAEKDQQKTAGNVAKDVAANAAGGGSQAATLIEDKDVIDKLISPKGNPNVF